MKEVFYQCPYCFSEVSILLDPSVLRQELIEDCERCCNPIEFIADLSIDGEIQAFSAEPIGQ